MNQREDLAQDSTVEVDCENDKAVDEGGSLTDDNAFGGGRSAILCPADLNINANYEIVSKIGSGGMGDVYLGKDLVLDRPVAIKVMHNPLSSEHVLRFQREGQILGRLNHPHIAPIYQLDLSEQGQFFIAMEYVIGTPLSQIIAEQAPLNPYWILTIVQQLSSVLKAAHDVGITHRDLKPANILVAKDAYGFDTIKVIDFGIAKDVSSGQDLTKSGEVLGSPLYMSPEQCTGGTVDYRTDIYSAGCIIFEMLTGNRPFQGDSVLQTISKHVTEGPPILPKHLKSFNKIMSKLLAKNPDERYQSLGLAHLDFIAAVIRYGQFKYSPFMFAALTRQRQLPTHTPRPLLVLCSLFAVALAVTVCSIAVPFPAKQTFIFITLLCVFLAICQLFRMLFEPLKVLKENERLLAKGPAQSK